MMVAARVVYWVVGDGVVEGGQRSSRWVVELELWDELAHHEAGKVKGDDVQVAYQCGCKPKLFLHDMNSLS